MSTNLPDEIGRKRPACMGVFSTGNLSEIVFATVCTKNNKRILACADVHRVLISAWAAADHWLVGKYVIMPDHLHLFCSPGDPSRASDVKNWIRYWKRLATRSWPRPEERPIWQLDAWDTQLRKGDSYSEKWDYVRNNPVRHGLVQQADDWPYQGELNELLWHDP